MASIQDTLQSLNDALKTGSTLPEDTPGSLEFIQMLLLKAGIESNPGPRSREATSRQTQPTASSAQDKDTILTGVAAGNWVLIYAPSLIRE